MYWQKRFDKEDSNKELEEKILAIRKDNKDFGSTHHLYRSYQT